MEETSFRDMREEDLPAVLDIYNHYITTTTATFDPDAVTRETVRVRIPIGHDLYKAYVICHMGKMAGFCFLSQFKSHKSYDRTAQVSVYLKPEHTRQGLGTKAVRHLGEVAAARGLKVIVASISGENEGSIQFFRKLGWEQCAHFRGVGEKWGRAMDVIVFQSFLASTSQRVARLLQTGPDQQYWPTGTGRCSV